ncbi:hypothetical protein F5888DRAFT_1694652 [Russula emetica]|nr:hypothetical protein F5888DRAFT_1694652 [Russula emetica]
MLSSRHCMPWPLPSLLFVQSFNSLGQSACTIAAFMMSTCNAGSFTVDPLQPGYSYTGPGGTDDSNLCTCSTVVYSLISACAGSQGEDWISWSEYVTNCANILPPSSFPNPIPSGTRVPQWALLDVTNENSWNANESFVVGDSPEVGPGMILGPSGASVSAIGPTSTSGDPFSITTTPAFIERHSSNGGAIIGGVIGGIAAISILVAALFFYRRRRRSLVQSPVFEGDIAFDPHMDQVSRSTLSQGTASPCPPETPTSLLTPYVHILILSSSSACVCLHNSLFSLTLST